MKEERNYNEKPYNVQQAFFYHRNHQDLPIQIAYDHSLLKPMLNDLPIQKEGINVLKSILEDHNRQEVIRKYEICKANQQIHFIFLLYAASRCIQDKTLKEYFLKRLFIYQQKNADFTRTEQQRILFLRKMEELKLSKDVVETFIESRNIEDAVILIMKQNKQENQIKKFIQILNTFCQEVGCNILLSIE